MIEIVSSPLAGLFLLKMDVFQDDRGYFLESFRRERFLEIGIDVDFVQDDESGSRKNVFRGLHFQRAPYEQAKLVRVSAGRIWDVVVDIRPESPDFGKHFGVELAAENKLQLFIPHGFAHGFIALSDFAVVQYKCDNRYQPGYEGGIAFDDPALGIVYPIAREEMILSERDRRHRGWEQFL